ncbi:MAG: glycoside hydrolase family 5 protein [Bacilli bacterium]
MKRFLQTFLIIFLFLTTTSPTFASEQPIGPWTYQKMLGHGVDVDWSKTASGREHYDVKAVIAFKKAGVRHVRIRVSDDVSKELLQSLEQQVSDCLKYGIIPIIAYQADPFKNNPNETTIRDVVTWWGQVASHFQKTSDRLAFDILIEASDEINKKPELLNTMFEAAVTEIRRTNPKRIIMISPRLRSDPTYLNELRIPSKHNHYLMAEWHFYASGPSPTNPRKKWTTGTPAEKKLITDQIQKALNWQKKTKIPTWVGAWMPGNYNDGDNYTVLQQSRFAAFMRAELDKAKIPFAVNSDTKFYDREQNVWLKEMSLVWRAIFLTNFDPQ